MANEVMSVVDPLGNTIYLSVGLCIDDGTPEPEIYDNALTVIQKPAMMLKLETEFGTEHYYFRSVGWQNTLLITVKFKNNRWESSKCLKNPSNDLLSTLLKKGKQLI